MRRLRFLFWPGVSNDKNDECERSPFVLGNDFHCGRGSGRDTFTARKPATGQASALSRPKARRERARSQARPARPSEGQSEEHQERCRAPCGAGRGPEEGSGQDGLRRRSVSANGEEGGRDRKARQANQEPRARVSAAEAPGKPPELGSSSPRNMQPAASSGQSFGGANDFWRSRNCLQ